MTYPCLCRALCDYGWIPTRTPDVHGYAVWVHATIGTLFVPRSQADLRQITSPEGWVLLGLDPVHGVLFSQTRPLEEHYARIAHWGAP